MADGQQQQQTPSSDRARYEFKRKLEQLRNIKGGGTQLISLYIPPGTQISDVNAQLRSEFSQAQNIKSKQTMKNVTSALESCMQAIKGMRFPPENGMVIFVGAKSIQGGEDSKMVRHVIVPPQPITLRKYHCDSNFYLEPLEGMLREQNNYGLVVLDRQEATIGFLRGQAVQVVTNMQSQVPNKHAKGGQSARRMERITEEIAEKWFDKIGDIASEVFMPELERGELKGVLVGGPGPTKEYWLEGEKMDYRLMQKIIGQPIDTGYTDEYGLRDLVQNAHTILQNLGLTEEKDIMQRFLREVGKESGGLSTYGEEHVRKAIQIGAVDTLLLSEKLRQIRVTVRSEQTGEETTHTTADVDALVSRLGATIEGGVEIVEEKDVVEELGEYAESMGGKVKIISAQSDEGELLFKAFGGIAAILRFKID